jgi:PhnB protein
VTTVKEASMTKSVKPIPEGFHSITPMLTVTGASQAIDFYKRAFGAEELMRMPGPDGKSVMHAELQFGDSRVFLADEHPDAGCRSPQSLGGTSVSLHLYVNDVDKVFAQAVAAGARSLMPVADMFWGDRFGRVADPFGHEWSLATHKEDLTDEEMRKRASVAMAAMRPKAKAASAGA